MYLVKKRDGSFIPASNSDHEQAKKIGVGTEVKATRARNPGFHRKIFALFKLAHENQDKIESFEAFIKILVLKAGYFHEVPNKHGEPYYIPKSLSYEEMNAETFEKVFNDVLSVVAKEMEAAPDDIRNELGNFY